MNHILTLCLSYLNLAIILRNYSKTWMDYRIHSLSHFYDHNALINSFHNPFQEYTKQMRLSFLPPKMWVNEPSWWVCLPSLFLVHLFFKKRDLLPTKFFLLNCKSEKDCKLNWLKFCWDKNVQ